MVLLVWLAHIRVEISRPPGFRFPGEGGWLPAWRKDRKFIVNANHQNLGDTLLLAHMIIALNITNPGAGIWCIWGAYKVLPPLWSCGLWPWSPWRGTRDP